MPKLNGTGPVGQGTRTGRGFGSCGCEIGRSCGCGNCCCNNGFGFRKFSSPRDEITSLEDAEKILEKELAEIKEERAALKKQQT